MVTPDDNDLSYGALLMLTEGHGTSEISRRIEAALKAKDEEITNLKARLHHISMLRIDDGEKYNVLLDQAIRFAEYIIGDMFDDDPRYVEAEQFLARPDVQARWKEQG